MADTANALENQQVEQPVDQQPEQGQDVQVLTINDLILLKRIVEATAERGAFKAVEMEDVGRVYKKLASFVDATVAQIEGQQESTEGGEGQPEVPAGE